MSAIRTARTCQECGKGQRRGNTITFSKRDKRYLHGSCRGEGKPYSHGKAKERRDWYVGQQKIARSQKVIVAGENAPMPIKVEGNTAHEKLESYVDQYRRSGRGLLDMSMGEFKSLTGLMTDAFFEEAKSLVEKGLKQEEQEEMERHDKAVDAYREKEFGKREGDTDASIKE